MKVLLSFTLFTKAEVSLQKQFSKQFSDRLMYNQQLMKFDPIAANLRSTGRLWLLQQRGWKVRDFII